MANHKKYRIKLTEEERSTLQVVAKGRRGRMTIATWKVERANVKLKCDESENGPAWTNEQLAEAMRLSRHIELV